MGSEGVQGQQLADMSTTLVEEHEFNQPQAEGIVNAAVQIIDIADARSKANLEALLTRIDERFDDVEKRFDKVDERLDRVVERLLTVEFKVKLRIWQYALTTLMLLGVIMTFFANCPRLLEMPQLLSVSQSVPTDVGLLGSIDIEALVPPDSIQ